LNDAGGIVRPDKQWQARPAHARGAHPVNRDHEIQPRQDRREACDEDRQPRLDNLGIAKGSAERHVERPAGIHSTGQHAVQHHHAADDVEIPAQEVDFREGQVFRPDHQGHEEVPEHGGN
jgi:hypothetical protein